MSELENYKVNELKIIAEELGVDLGSLTKKAEILDELDANGITLGMVKEHVFPDPEPEPEAEAVVAPQRTVQTRKPNLSGETYVIKMTRNNRRWDAYGDSGAIYTFTYEHPYQIVAADDADLILEEFGFRLATPKELRDYYA
jgi:hypothetical protein